MVFIAVPEDRLLELIKLSKPTIVQRIISILRECDHVQADDSDSDGEGDRPDSVAALGPCGGKKKGCSSVELLE